MDAKNINDLLTYSSNNLSNFSDSQRYTYYEVEEKVKKFMEKGGLNIVLLIGLRGVGKTTILKTIAKKYSGLYTSGDFLKTKNFEIENITEIAKQEDIRVIIIDEILYMSDWQIKLKIEADTNQKILYLISGSSAMQLKKISQDLSRRLDIYKLNPMSFMEYLKINNNLTIHEKINLDIFSKKNIESAYLELSKIKGRLPKNIFSLFRSYYEMQLPYLLEEKNLKEKINQLIEKIIYKDMPMIDNIYTEQLKNAELIVKYLATAEKVNYTNIATNLQIKKDMVIKIINLLEKSEIISIIPDIVPTRELRTNKKILFATPSIRLALNEINEDRVIGFAREDMFGLIMNNSKIKFGYNYKQDGFDYIAKGIKFEIGNNKSKIKPGIIVVGDFTDLDIKNNVLYVPFYIFALINN